MADRDRYEHEALEFARAVTFFDAIFAFSVTLLITTVDDFSPHAWSSLSALRDANGSALLAFAISFIVVVTFWRSNHREISGFRALDGQLVFMNCMVMFTIVLIPFTTEALGKPELKDLPLPVAVYAVNIVAAYLLQCAVTVVGDRRGLRVTTMTPHEFRWALIRFSVLPIVFLGSVPVAYLVGRNQAQYCWIAAAVLEPAIERLRRTLESREPGSAAQDLRAGQPPRADDEESGPTPASGR